MTLPEPVKVSPIIKLFRYGLLMAGIIYGASKYKVLQAKEAGKKEEKERKKAERDAQIAEEKRIASERDITNLVAIFSAGSESNQKTAEKLPDNDEPCSFKDKANSDDACTFKEVENKPTNNPEVDTTIVSESYDMFSEKLDLSNGKPKSGYIPKGNADTPIDIPQNNQVGDRNSPTVPTNEDEYFIETFKDNVPYAATPDNKVSDFLPK